MELEHNNEKHNVIWHSYLESSKTEKKHEMLKETCPRQLNDGSIVAEGEMGRELQWQEKSQIHFKKLILRTPAKGRATCFAHLPGDVFRTSFLKILQK